MTRKVYIIDVTNRDGVQTARIGLSKLQKTMINLYLSRMGIYQVELGFPFTEQEKNYINANESLQKKGALKNLVLEGWCRAVKSDVEKAMEYTNLKALNLSISTSEIMTEGKFKGSVVRRPEEDPSKRNLIDTMQTAVKTALSKGVEYVGVNAEDASRTDIEYLIDFGFAAKAAGACRLRYCDTLGYDTPETIYERVKKLAEEVKIDIEPHCHNDLGCAVGNSIMAAMGAIDAGVDAYINTTVNGYGERAGNADLVSCLLMLKYGSRMPERGFEIGDIDLKMFRKISKYAAHAFDQPMPINQPAVGNNAFAHESGIHTDGALKDRHNYELFDYDIFGDYNEYAHIPGKYRSESSIAYFGDVKLYENDLYENKDRVILAGEYGGMAGLKHVYGLLNIEFKDDESAKWCLDLVRQANAHNQMPLTNDELRFIAAYPEETSMILSVDYIKTPEFVLSR
ncbi:MAG: homocitrate synthase [Cyanobacteriota bacterium]